MAFRLDPDGSPWGSVFGFSSPPIGWVEGWMGTSVGRRLLSACPPSLLLVPGRVSLLCAWKRPQVLGVVWSAQLLEGLSARQWVTEGFVCGEEELNIPLRAGNGEDPIRHSLPTWWVLGAAP